MEESEVREVEVKVGDIVGYVLESGYNTGQLLPAIVVRVWSPTCVQLQVFTDGDNDGPEFEHGHVWRTSVTYDPTRQMGRSFHFLN